MLYLATVASQRRLDAYQRQLRKLASELARTGFVRSGSVVKRYMPCGNPGCRCHADPPQLHGPYWQWSARVNGKTVTRRLSERQARLYQEWIRNRRQVSRIIAKMERISQAAGELLLAEAG
jgi:hypothetical protein